MVGLVAIVDSTFIIITSLLDGMQNYELHANHLHRSARKLNRLLGDMSFQEFGNHTQNDLVRLNTKYADILDECPTDHGNLDYRWSLKRNPELFSHLLPAERAEAMGSSGFLLVCRTYVWMTPHVVMLLISFYIVVSSSFGYGLFKHVVPEVNDDKRAQIVSPGP